MTMIIAGHWRAMNPVIREYKRYVDKLPPEADGYRIAIISDVHLSVTMNEKWFNKNVDRINALNPDLILLVGDVLDETYKDAEWVVKPLRRFKATDGVWASTGNHDFYYGIDSFMYLMREAGINVLRNEAAIVADKIILGAVDDKTATDLLKVERVPIAAIVDEFKHRLPIVFMNHTPNRREEAEKLNVEVYISGHTHHGQLWPLGYITETFYSIKTGIQDENGMLFIHSTGLGTWGPPMRINATPEIILVVLKSPER